MDLLRGCSGTTFCYFAKTFQRACFNFLAQKRLLPKCGYELGTAIHVFPRNPVLATSILRIPIFFPRQNLARKFSTKIPNEVFAKKIEPFELVDDDLKLMSKKIQNALQSDLPAVESIARYYFESGGKLIRPTIILLMSRTISVEKNENSASRTKSVEKNANLADNQKKIAAVAEMIHVASLVHDDVIDESKIRRQRPTVGHLWGNRKAILIGNYILAKATQLLFKFKNKPNPFILFCSRIPNSSKAVLKPMPKIGSEVHRFY